MKLAPDLIYEATLDDELFSELPAIIASWLGARSCVLHWRDHAGATEISAHSGYFTDAQMGNYAANFTSHDLWTEAGMRQGFVNKAWKTTDLVPSSAYQSSIFYNEWIRSMGDDTFYCCGSVMQTAHGHGIIGLHRGKTQSDFEGSVLSDLDGHVGHLRRMFAIRARIASLTDRNNLLDALFASTKQAVMMVSSSGRLLMANDAGDRLLRSGTYLRGRGGRVGAASAAGEGEFDAALAAATRGADRQASTCLLKNGDNDFVIASLMPLVTPSSEAAAMVTIEQNRQRPSAELVARHLEQAFHLSPAEADIAIRLAGGATVREISDGRRSSVGTVRTQVKSILLKMDARRQGDVVRIVGAISRSEPFAA